MQVESPRLSILERLYLPEIVRGVTVTSGHFARNLWLHALHLFGVARDRPAMVTVQYPEQRKVYSENYRGSHRLTANPDPEAGCNPAEPGLSVSNIVRRNRMIARPSHGACAESQTACVRHPLQSQRTCVGNRR